MADEQKGILARLLTETWPAKAATGVLDALMLPGQVAGGLLNVQPSRPGVWSDEDEARSQLTNQTMMQRASDLGGLMFLGSGAVPAAANELRAGIPKQAFLPDGRVQTGWVMRDVERMPTDPATNRLRNAMNKTEDYSVQEVPLRSLLAGQPYVNSDFAQAAAKRVGDGLDLPAVYKTGGKYYLTDGHHRAVAAAQNADTVKVRLYDMDGGPGQKGQMSLFNQFD